MKNYLTCRINYAILYYDRSITTDIVRLSYYDYHTMSVVLYSVKTNSKKEEI